MILPFVSKLDITEKAGLTVNTLARSSKVSWLEKEPLDLNPRRNWGESTIEPDGPYPLLAEARGTLPKREKENTADTQAKAIDDKTVESRLVVMGTSRIC